MCAEGSRRSAAKCRPGTCRWPGLPSPGQSGMPRRTIWSAGTWRLGRQPHGPDRAAEPVVYLGAVPRAARGGAGVPAERLRGAEPGCRHPYRGGQGTALGSRRPRRRSQRGAARASVGGRMALSTAGRRHQDSQVTANPGAAPSGRPCLAGDRKRQAEDRLAAGALWQDHDLVFASIIGTPLDAANVRREFRKITEAAHRLPPAAAPDRLPPPPALDRPLRPHPRRQLDVSPFPEILRAQRRHLAQLRHHPWQHVEAAISAATRAIYQARGGTWIPGQRQRLQQLAPGTWDQALAGVLGEPRPARRRPRPSHRRDRHIPRRRLARRTPASGRTAPATAPRLSRSGERFGVRANLATKLSSFNWKFSCRCLGFTPASLGATNAEGEEPW